MSNVKQYKVAIIGCGNIAGGYDASYHGGGDYVLTHAGAYGAHDGFEIVACVDPDEAKRTAFQERWQIPVGFATIEELKNSALHLDVISLCAPTAFHVADLTIALDMEPRLVYAEKPLSDHVAASEKLLVAYKRQNISLAVNYFRQWDPVLQDLAEEVKAGEWGTFQNATLCYAKGVLNNATHYLNLARMFLGEMTAHSVVDSVDDYNENDPTLSGIVSVDKGGYIFLAGGDARHFISTELTLNFTKGRIAIQRMGLVVRLRRPEDNPLYEGYRWLGPAMEKETGFARAMVCAVDNIYNHLENQVPLVCRGEDALAVQRLAQDMIDLNRKEN